MRALLCRWFGHRWYPDVPDVPTTAGTVTLFECKRCGALQGLL